MATICWIVQFRLDGKWRAKEAAGIERRLGRAAHAQPWPGRPGRTTIRSMAAERFGQIMNSDLEVHRDVRNGAVVARGTNPAVSQGTRPVPLIFGGMAPSAPARMVRRGEGYARRVRPGGNGDQCDWFAARTTRRSALLNVTTRTLVPLPIRRYFRGLSSDYSVLRLISAMWEDQDFIASGDRTMRTASWFCPREQESLSVRFEAGRNGRCQ